MEQSDLMGMLRDRDTNRWSTDQHFLWGRPTPDAEDALWAPELGCSEMRITIDRERTVEEILDSIHARYGSRQQLEAHVDEHPQDWEARVALHDLEEYGDADPTMGIQDVREVVLPDAALDELTFRRVQLLVRLKQAGGEVEGVRKLARALDRDKKNVSQDLEALRELGLVSVHPRGPGRAHRIELAGERIDLHLLEAEG